MEYGIEAGLHGLRKITAVHGQVVRNNGAVGHRGGGEAWCGYRIKNEPEYIITKSEHVKKK